MNEYCPAPNLTERVELLDPALVVQVTIVARLGDVVVVIAAAIVAPVVRGARVADIAGAVVPLGARSAWSSRQGLSPLVIRRSPRVAIVPKDDLAHVVGR